MKKFAILGHPVAHSLSPKIHNAVFQALGLKDYVYEFYDCPPERLGQAMRELREGKYSGYSVTIPHKQAVMKYCDEFSAIAKKLVAANTLIRTSDGKIFADNTDYVGFKRSLEESHLTLSPQSSTALVLGSGGASKAIVAVLKDLGFNSVIASRNPKDASAISYDQLDPDAPYSLIVNTTPVGMLGNDRKDRKERKENNELLLTDPRWYKANRVYVDVIYTPKITPFLKRAQEAEAKIITGDRMFLWQAVLQAKLFCGREDIPVDVMEKALASTTGP